MWRRGFEVKASCLWWVYMSTNAGRNQQFVLTDHARRRGPTARALL